MAFDFLTPQPTASKKSAGQYLANLFSPDNLNNLLTNTGVSAGLPDNMLNAFKTQLGMTGNGPINGGVMQFYLPKIAKVYGDDVAKSIQDHYAAAQKQQVTDQGRNVEGFMNQIKGLGPDVMNAWHNTYSQPAMQAPDFASALGAQVQAPAQPSGLLGRAATAANLVSGLLGNAPAANTGGTQ